ncbi:MAG: efflux RND transporter periplasmic adaptor subunit [Gammaproteobacteria bacterium]
MKQWGKRLFLTALVIALLGGIGYLLKRREPVAVTLYTVLTGTVRSTVANTRVGTVKACRRAYLAPAAGGEVASLPVHKGDAVKAGQILLEVWNDDLKAQAKLRTAEIQSRRAAAAQACYLAGGAEREAARLTKLQQYNQVVSEQQVDRAQTDAKSQRAACRSAEAAIAVAQAGLSVAQAAVDRTILRAPFDGTIAEINAELGEYITPSPPGIPTLPAIDLLDLSCIYVSAPIDEVDVRQIRVGMPACVSLDAFPKKRCSGKVSRIAPYVLEKEKQARTVEVEVKLTDPQELQNLLPGYSADIEVLIASKDNVLRIPTEAVLEGRHVLLFGPQGILQEREFQPGLSNWNYTEVLAGLQAGERIVVSVGREGVKAGAKAVEDKAP